MRPLIIVAITLGAASLWGTPVQAQRRSLPIVDIAAIGLASPGRTLPGISAGASASLRVWDGESYDLRAMVAAIAPIVFISDGTCIGTGTSENCFDAMQNANQVFVAGVDFIAWKDRASSPWYGTGTLGAYMANEAHKGVGQEKSRNLALSIGVGRVASVGTLASRTEVRLWSFIGVFRQTQWALSLSTGVGR